MADEIAYAFQAETGDCTSGSLLVKYLSMIPTQAI